MSLTTVNGPAPTGLSCERLLAHLLQAVGEAIQFAVESKIWLMNAPSGALQVDLHRVTALSR